MKPLAPRVIAGLLSILGIYWAVRLLGWLVAPGVFLVALPGYLIFAGWICRVFDCGSRSLYLVVWLGSMVWHMMLVTVGPIIAGFLSDHFPVYLYGAVVLPLSIVGFILDARVRGSEAAQGST
jgi:hypothetical protein